MFISNLFNRFQLISISLALCANVPVLAQVKPLETFDNSSELFAQLTTARWRRFNLDSHSSIIIPGYSATTKDGVEGIHNGIKYFAGSTTLDTQIAQLCTVYNCDTVLRAIADEVIKERNLILEEVKPIRANSQQYTANGIEFIAKNNTSSVHFAGRIYLVSNRLYILMAGTNNNYFDNETIVFFDSLSLI